MNCLKTRAVMLLLLVLSMHQYVFARQVDDMAKMAAFADQLYAAGEYDNAILEYKRLMHYHPGTVDSMQVILADCYYMNEQYALATVQYYKALAGVIGAETKNYCQFQLGKCFIKDNQTPRAMEILLTIARDSSNAYRDASKYYLGYLYANQHDWQESSDWLKQVASDNTNFASANIISEAVLAGVSLPEKSPLVAGILSGVLPGAGYLYAGHGKIAFAALILNAMFIVGAYEAYQKELYTVGTTFAVIGSGWYVGNIYGSMNKARQYNRNIRIGFVYRLEFDL